MSSQLHPAAAQFLAQASQTLRRGDFKEALALIAQAEAATPPHPEVFMARAVSLRMAGDLVQSLAAIELALQLDPYHFFALLSKGAALESLSGPKAAAETYRNALKIAPPDNLMPPAILAQARHARDVMEADRKAIAEFVEARLGAAIKDAPFRFHESLQILTGKAKPFVQEPLYFHYPQLPAITFYPRDMFPWLPKLEAATDMIREELSQALGTIGGSFKPYIQYPTGAPVNQWAELNHSERWSTLFLWKDGIRRDDACAVCPGTSALLDELPLAHQQSFGPTVMFSRLDPHTAIPAHTGSSNVRLIAHLPLVLPGPARFRVGNETRPWKLGEGWVFDDTIEHEAWNDADEARVVLIFDVWNPFLSNQERDLVTQLMLARREFYGS
jgi:aspartate beta-hydroxylase